MKKLTSSILPGLPETIHLLIAETSECPGDMAARLAPSDQLKYSNIGSGYRALEFITGRWLLQKLMSERGFERSDWSFEYSNSGKPWLKVEPADNTDQYLPVGIAHTRDAVLAGFSDRINFGVDIENLNRKAHPSLQKRIVHPGVLKTTTDQSPVRIWSIKEAALKLCGKGLRVGMDKLKITEWHSWGCRLAMDDGQPVNVVNTKVDHYWIAVAWYQKETSS